MSNLSFVFQPKVRTKAPNEIKTLTFDFLGKMRVGDTVASIVEVTTTSGLTLGTPTLNGAKVSVNVSGGSESEQYTVRATVLTTLGNTLTLTATVLIQTGIN